MILKRQSEEEDRQLEQLVLQAQHYPPRSLMRQQALNQLIIIVRSSGRLLDLRDRLNCDQYEEMEQKFWLYICGAVEKYDPNKGSVMAWLNTLLYKRFYKEELLVKVEGKNRKDVPDAVKALSNYVLPENNLLLRLKDLITLDPDRIFQSKHIKNCPQANFQKLTELHLAGYSWEEISQELGVKASTLKSFYHRTLKKLKSVIREYLIN